VSSTPDDGTLTLYQADPKRIIPFLGPYRTRGDMTGWQSDPAVQANVEGRLARGIYKGIGEFHLTAADADKPVVKRFAELAAQQQLFLHAHVDAVALEKLLAHPLPPSSGPVHGGDRHVGDFAVAFAA